MKTSVHHSTRSIVSPAQRLKVAHCPSRLVMRKSGIHPKYYEEAKVYCKGEHVMTVSGTQEEYKVDVWSGNHPLYQGSKSANAADDGPLSRFNSKYEGMEDLLEVPNLGTDKAEGLEAFKKKGGKKK